VKFQPLKFSGIITDSCARGQIIFLRSPIKTAEFEVKNRRILFFSDNNKRFRRRPLGVNAVTIFTDFFKK